MVIVWVKLVGMVWGVVEFCFGSGWEIMVFVFVGLYDWQQVFVCFQVIVVVVMFWIVVKGVMDGLLIDLVMYVVDDGSFVVFVNGGFELNFVDFVILNFLFILLEGEVLLSFMICRVLDGWFIWEVFDVDGVEVVLGVEYFVGVVVMVLLDDFDLGFYLIVVKVRVGVKEIDLIIMVGVVVDIFYVGVFVDFFYGIYFYYGDS